MATCTHQCTTHRRNATFPVGEKARESEPLMRLIRTARYVMHGTPYSHLIFIFFLTLWPAVNVWMPRLLSVDPICLMPKLVVSLSPSLRQMAVASSKSTRAMALAACSTDHPQFIIIRRKRFVVYQRGQILTAIQSYGTMRPGHVRHTNMKCRCCFLRRFSRTEYFIATDQCAVLSQC